MVELGSLGCGMLSVFAGVLLIGTTVEYRLEAGLFFLGLGVVLVSAGWR